MFSGELEMGGFCLIQCPGSIALLGQHNHSHMETYFCQPQISMATSRLTESVSLASKKISHSIEVRKG